MRASSRRRRRARCARMPSSHATIGVSCDHAWRCSIATRKVVCTRSSAACRSKVRWLATRSSSAATPSNTRARAFGSPVSWKRANCASSARSRTRSGVLARSLASAVRRSAAACASRACGARGRSATPAPRHIPPSGRPPHPGRLEGRWRRGIRTRASLGPPLRCKLGRCAASHCGFGLVAVVASGPPEVDPPWVMVWRVVHGRLQHPDVLGCARQTEVSPARAVELTTSRRVLACRPPWLRPDALSMHGGACAASATAASAGQRLAPAPRHCSPSRQPLDEGADRPRNPARLCSCR